MTWLARRRAIHSVSGRYRLISAARSATAVILLSGCVLRRHSEEVAMRRSPARDSLLLIDLQRTDSLASRGPAMPLASYFAPDVVYLRAGARSTFGRDNVIALLAAKSLPAVTTTWQPLGGGLSLDGLAGYTYGVAAYTSAETRSPGLARYVAFWKRQRGDRWQIVAFAEVGAGSPVVTAPPDVGTEVPLPGLTPPAARAARAIAAADSDFADEAGISGVASAFGDAVAADGAIFGGTELIVGPRAIRDYFEEQRGVSLSWHPVYAYGAASGDLGFSVGESVLTLRGQSGAAVQRFGKYLTVWRREANGDWKFVVDGGNSRPSPVGK